MIIPEKKELVKNVKKDFLIAHYNYLSKEIRFAKRQLITGTTQIFALFGGIILVHDYWPKWEICDMEIPIIVGFFLNIILFFIGIVFVCSCDRSMNNSDKRLKHLRCNYFPLFCEMEEAINNNEVIKDPSSITSKLVTWFYYLFIFVAFIITLFRIWN